MNDADAFRHGYPLINEVNIHPFRPSSREDYERSRAQENTVFLASLMPCCESNGFILERIDGEPLAPFQLVEKP
ncbi:hypothetical protein [Rhodanobacter sp. OK091]|uniref:hypothetical protein n=1 Tax=Rhodanobacter sp. OK091 TaxID=1881037 RepID=UPI00092483AA|nr:hypothetical protein [Rhodanobacter sp. OK091]SHM20347.1 hypothetical protein SAMN05428972_2843 [Rhodanobacter sp. OK091]